MKKGEKYFYEVCEFDGYSIDEVVVKEVYADHVICDFTASSMSGVTLWFTEEDLGICLFKTYEEAKEKLARDKAFYPWL